MELWRRVKLCYANVMETPDKPRRDFLFLATGGVAAFGLAAVTRPLVGHMSPAGDAVSYAVDVDLFKLEEGMEMRVLYRGRPVAIRHRTPAEIKAAQADDTAKLPHMETDRSRLRLKPDRTVDPRFLVFHPICSHFGCTVVGKAGDFDGWYCPCHGAHFDTSGRVRKGPAPRNMDIPDYFWATNSTITLRELTVFERMEAKTL